MDTGDMFHPSCSLCRRTQATCIYPTGRKSGRRRRRNIMNPRSDSGDKRADFSREEDESLASEWDLFFNLGNTPNVSVPDQSIFQQQLLLPPQPPPPPQQQQPQHRVTPSARLDISNDDTGRASDLHSNFLLPATDRPQDPSIEGDFLARAAVRTDPPIALESVLPDIAEEFMSLTPPLQSLETSLDGPSIDVWTNINFSMSYTGDAALFKEPKDQSPLSSLSISEGLAHDL